MKKTFRILGRRGRITIPYNLRVLMGIQPNDLVSFRLEGEEIIVKREKICDNCNPPDHPDISSTKEALREFLDALPIETQRDALLYLSLEIAKTNT